MPHRTTGHYVAGTLAGSRYQAFVPGPLPPVPALDFAQVELVARKERADQALGRLEGITLMLPDPELLLYQYVRKEALLSSQIEGAQSSLSDLLLFEMDAAPGIPMDDVEEVSNYVAALNHGLRRLREDDFPLSLRLIREMHALLLQGGRGASKQPGEFRRSQVWVGAASPALAHFVSPPPDAVPGTLAALEQFLHAPPGQIPPLVKAALAHVQFETIHPFSDGHGRLGRLLITLILCSEGVLRELSLYFKRRRADYYDRLNAVRLNGDWERVAGLLSGWRGRNRPASCRCCAAIAGAIGARPCTHCRARPAGGQRGLGVRAIRATCSTGGAAGCAASVAECADNPRSGTHAARAENRQQTHRPAAASHLCLSGISRHPQRRSATAVSNHFAHRCCW